MDVEYPTLVELCDKFTKETGIEVVLLKVPFKDLRNKYYVATPAGLGPDLLLGALDWIGILQTTGLIAPIPSSFSYDDFTDVAQKAATYENEKYMVPLCMETLALFRNTDIMPKRPETMEELIANAMEIQKKYVKPGTKERVNGFYFEIKDLYFSIPFLTQYGGYLLGEKDGQYDPMDVGLGNAGAIRGAEFLRALRDDKQYGLIKAGCSESISRTLFYDGNAAVIINGPWMLRELKNRNNDPNKHHVKYSVDPFPPDKEGNLPRPSVGMQGLMLNSYSRNPEAAAKLIEYLAGTEQMLALSKSSGRPPTTHSALALITDDPDIVAFSKACDNGFPMPSHPACQAIWEPMKMSLELIANGVVEASVEMPSATERIKDKIRLMME